MIKKYNVSHHIRTHSKILSSAMNLVWNRLPTNFESRKLLLSLVTLTHWLTGAIQIASSARPQPIDLNGNDKSITYWRVWMDCRIVNFVNWLRIYTRSGHTITWDEKWTHFEKNKLPEYGISDRVRIRKIVCFFRHFTSVSMTKKAILNNIVYKYHRQQHVPPRVIIIFNEHFIEIRHSRAHIWNND